MHTSRIIGTSTSPSEHVFSSLPIGHMFTPGYSKICQVYAQLSARGTTLLFGSGDSGAGCDFINNATNFIANFPATCP